LLELTAQGVHLLLQELEGRVGRTRRSQFRRLPHQKNRDHSHEYHENTE
jgi:hypothetical protein